MMTGGGALKSCFQQVDAMHPRHVPIRDSNIIHFQVLYLQCISTISGLREVRGASCGKIFFNAVVYENRIIGNMNVVCGNGHESMARGGMPVFVVPIVFLWRRKW